MTFDDRGGIKMELNDYLYNQDRKVKNKLYWRCEDRQCKGHVITTDGIPLKTTSQTTHGPCKFEVEVQKSIARLKEHTTASQEPSTRLINRELQILILTFN